MPLVGGLRPGQGFWLLGPGLVRWRAERRSFFRREAIQEVGQRQHLPVRHWGEAPQPQIQDFAARSQLLAYPVSPRQPYGLAQKTYFRRLHHAPTAASGAPGDATRRRRAFNAWLW